MNLGWLAMDQSETKTSKMAQICHLTPMNCHIASLRKTAHTPNSKRAKNSPRRGYMHRTELYGDRLCMAICWVGALYMMYWHIIH